MKILLALPAAESVRVTRERPGVTKRAMLRFSALPLTSVRALIRAAMALKLNLTYRYDNKRERIIGRNPAQAAARDNYLLAAWQMAGGCRLRL